MQLFAHQKAMEIIREGHGRHFNPAIVDFLVVIEEPFIEIAGRFWDERYKERSQKVPRNAAWQELPR